MNLAKWMLLPLLFTVVSPVQGQARVASFEVATVKPTAATDGHTHINNPPGDRFSASNVTILALMQWAYRMPESQILGGPAWLGSTRFDIEATTGPVERAKGPGSISDQDLKRLMVQVLLAERFQLIVHPEVRTLAAYALVVAKGGAKLAVAVGGQSIGVGRDHLTVAGQAMAQIAEQLAKIAGRVVVDKTGLTGRYDFQLQWAAEDAVDFGPSLFTAIQEQLGLKLEAAKEPVAVLVVERVELPSGN